MKTAKSRILKCLSILLCVLMIASLITACGGDESGENTGSGDSGTVSGERTVAVIIPASASDIINSVAGKVKTLCEDAGYTVTMYNESQTVANESYRVYVGNVNTETSIAHLSELGSCGYGVKADRTGVYLSATAETLLDLAYDMLEKQGLPADSLTETVKSENAVFSEFTYIIKDAAMSMTVSGDTSVSGISGALKELTMGLAATLKKTVTSENGNNGDLVLMSTSAAVVKGITDDARYNAYGMSVKDGKIYIYANDQAGYSAAVTRFLAIVKDISDYKDSRALFYPTELRLLEEINSAIPALPLYPGSTVYDEAVAESYTISAESSGKQAFYDYCTALENDGYRLAEDRARDCTYENSPYTFKNIYRTYINSRYMVHMYFIDYTKTVKIIGAPISEYEAAQQLVATEGDGDTVFSMLKISGGLCMAIKLSDGRFIVIDSGNWSLSDTRAADIVKLHDFLAENSPDGKIHIAAWIFTHVHVDHVNAAWKFEDMYGDEVIIERYMHNFVDYDFLLSVPDTDLSKATYDIVYPRTLEMLSRYDNVIMHTGQVYNIGNITIDVLYTHEDFYPQPLKIVNNSSTVMQITVEGNTFLIAGDLEEDGQQVAVSMNGYALASDFVQMTHHSYNGLLEYYKYASSKEYTVVLLPNDNMKQPTSTVACNQWLLSKANEFYSTYTGHHHFTMPHVK